MKHEQQQLSNGACVRFEVANNNNKLKSRREARYSFRKDLLSVRLIFLPNHQLLVWSPSPDSFMSKKQFGNKFPAFKLIL
jgi:hypothetical protein